MSKDAVNTESADSNESARAASSAEASTPGKLSAEERIARSKEMAAKSRANKSGSARERAKLASMTKEQQRHANAAAKEEDPNPVWFKPIMFGFLLAGLIWILVYYISEARLPIAEIRDWNLLVGIGLSMVGFLMMTNWK